MQKIAPFILFKTNAEEAMQFYTTVFKDAKILNVSHLAGGSIVTGTFEIAGQKFMALSGGPAVTATEAVSFFVNCETQAEVDELWEKLSDGGAPSQCGWVKDKYGISWQIVPTLFGKLLGDPDREKAGRAMNAMLQMTKLDMAKLQAAFDGQ